MKLKDIPEYFDTSGKRTVPELMAAGWRTVQWGTEYDDNHDRHPGVRHMLKGEVERTKIGIGWMNKYAGVRGQDWELYGLWLWIVRDPLVADRFKKELHGRVED